MSFDQSLAKLAASIAKRATDPNTNFQEMVDAFKALTTYYSTLKRNKVATEEKSNEPDFSSFQDAMNIVGNNGKPKV